MQSKKFSIITVSLNTLEDFKKTIYSINSQTYKNFEIIVIDGGSTDGTKEEINNNKNNFSNYLIEKDHGIYDAMNKGINFITSEWTIFLNAGDIFFDKSVLAQINSLDTSCIDIIYGKTVIDNQNVTYSDSPKKIDRNFILMPFCHQSSFVKTELIKKKFDTKYKVSSDFNFFLNCFKDQKKFFYIDKYLSRIKGGGLSDLSRQLVYNENIEILRKKNLNNEANFLYLYKIKDYFLSIIKKYVPQKMLTELIKIKNKKKLIKQ